MMTAQTATLMAAMTLTILMMNRRMTTRAMMTMILIMPRTLTMMTPSLRIREMTPRMTMMMMRRTLMMIHAMDWRPRTALTITMMMGPKCARSTLRPRTATRLCKAEASMERATSMMDTMLPRPRLRQRPAVEHRGWNYGWTYRSVGVGDCWRC